MLDRRMVFGGMLAALATPRSLIAQTCVSKGHYIGTVVAEFLPNGRSIRLRQPLTYVSRCGKRWTAPTGTVSDGASIPALLWRIAGTPLVGLYRDAAVIHDFYCSVRTEPYADVHQMFYEAMLASGVSAFDAAKFYLGVKLGGPSWDDLTIANETLARGVNVFPPPPPPPPPRTPARPIIPPSGQIATIQRPSDSTAWATRLAVARQTAAMKAARSVINDDLEKRKELDMMLAALPSANIALASADLLDQSAARYFVQGEQQRMVALAAGSAGSQAGDHMILPSQMQAPLPGMMAAPAAADGPR